MPQERTERGEKMIKDFRYVTIRVETKATACQDKTPKKECSLTESFLASMA
jgi:hypothetical protein